MSKQTLPEQLELWLVRHGETDWNFERRMQGHSQTRLSALGVRQAQCLAARLKGETFDAVYSSDLERALQTAQVVFPEREIIQDRRLREITYGVLDGTTELERTDEQNILLAHLRRDPAAPRAGDGENYRDVLARVEPFLAELPEQGKVIAFSHGGTIRTALHSVTGYGSSWAFAINNTGISKLVFQGSHVTLSFVNDHAHTLGLEPL